MALGRTPRHGLARVMSKRGLCSRSQAERLIGAGKVRLDGRVERNPECTVDAATAVIEVEGVIAAPVAKIHLLLNKPKGLVTTAHDEQGRDTVYRCFDGADLPWIAPVGRLDKASEGLLLFTNDPEWAARITHPDTGPDKTYHVQINRLPDTQLLVDLMQGVDVEGEWLSAASVMVLREGEKNAWLEIILDEGRNRQIRRLLAAFDIDVLRLVRVAIGEVGLGELPKGAWRALTPPEIRALGAG